MMQRNMCYRSIFLDSGMQARLYGDIVNISRPPLTSSVSRGSLKKRMNPNIFYVVKFSVLYGLSLDPMCALPFGCLSLTRCILSKCPPVYLLG